MSDEVQEPKIEINAPPKSIEIQASPVIEQPVASPNVQNQGAMLTGGIGQPQGNLMATMPQNVKFVMGPNGQMIAIEKPPFVWKQFFIGGGIPFALFFVPMLVLMIGVGFDLNDTYDTEQIVTLYKDENSTLYRGEFYLEEDNFLSWCHIYSEQNNDFPDVYCDRYDDYKAYINKSDGLGDELVGEWNNDNRTVYIDTGIDYGEELKFNVDYYSEDEAYDFFMFFEDISGLTCCLGLLLSIIFLIVGFSQGKPGMGWGGVTALVSFPVVSFLSVLVLW